MAAHYLEDLSSYHAVDCDFSLPVDAVQRHAPAPDIVIPRCPAGCPTQVLSHQYAVLCSLRAVVEDLQDNALFGPAAVDFFVRFPDPTVFDLLKLHGYAGDDFVSGPGARFLMDEVAASTPRFLRLLHNEPPLLGCVDRIDERRYIAGVSVAEAWSLAVRAAQTKVFQQKGWCEVESAVDACLLAGLCDAPGEHWTVRETALGCGLTVADRELVSTAEGASPMRIVFFSLTTPAMTSMLSLDDHRVLETLLFAVKQTACHVMATLYGEAVTIDHDARLAQLFQVSMELTPPPQAPPCAAGRRTTRGPGKPRTETFVGYSNVGRKSDFQILEVFLNH